MRQPAALALALVCSLASACARPEPQPQVAPALEASPARPWPQTFAAPAVLVAREVEIEGPPGLLEHVALRVDPRVHDYAVRTVPEGLLQEVIQKPDQAPEVVRCYLDQLEIAAETRLRVLQRPGDCELSITARGDAFFQRPGEAERRGEVLRLSESDAR
jgi:hypothetical protein